MKTLHYWLFSIASASWLWLFIEESKPGCNAVKVCSHYCNTTELNWAHSEHVQNCKLPVQFSHHNVSGHHSMQVFRNERGAVNWSQFSSALLQRSEWALKGNSTLKNISPKIHIYDKWSFVSVIKLTMQIRYRRILTIKLLISRNVFLHAGGSSRPSNLFLYLCLFVDVDMVNKNGCSYVLSCVKCALCLLSGRKFRNHSYLE